MRNTVVGVVAGLITGAVVGATVLAPHLVPPTVPQAAPMDAPAPAPNPEPKPEQAAAAEEPKREPRILWRVATGYPVSMPNLGTMAQSVERKLWRVSDGTFGIQLREPAPGETATDRLRSLTAGDVDAVFGTPAAWTDLPAALQLFGATPFGMSARPFLSWMESGNGKVLLAELLAAEGLSGLVCGVTVAEGGGWFKKPIRTAEDLRGLKIRIVGLGARVVERLGAKPVSLSGGGLFTAFESGTIDAVLFSVPATDAALQFHNLARYYYFPAWHAPSTIYYLITGTPKWNGLSAVQKAQVETVCGDNVQRALVEGDATQFPALRKLVREGADVRRLPAEASEALRESWNATVEEESMRNTQFRKVLASMRAFESDYRVWRELGAQ